MSRRLPSLESLRVFEACARHMNFTRAASELGVTPTAVSLRIRDLEADLGRRLFRRTGPRLSLTDAGAQLARQMDEIMALIHAAVDECRGTPEPLRVAAAPTFAARWLAPRLADYRAHDSGPIKLQVSTTLEPASQFDAAIRSGRGDWPGLEVIASLPVEATPMLSPDLYASADLTSAEGLLGLPLLPDDRWARWFDDLGIDAARAQFRTVSYPTQELAAAAALEGAGVALLSPTLFGSLVREGKLLRPFLHVTRGPDAYHAVVHAGEQRPPVLRFCDWLRREMAVTALAPEAP